MEKATETKLKLKKKTVKKTIKKAEPKLVVSGLHIQVFDLEGQEKGTMELPKEIFDVKINKALMAQYVRVYLMNQREGNASTLTRHEVRGSTRKIYKQKGTGKARHGSRKAPIFVGGGIVGGPKPKDYQAKINKKMKKIALYSALTMKVNAKEVIALDIDAKKMKPKTKLVSDFLKKMHFEKKKTLFVIDAKDMNQFVLAARNIPTVSLVAAHSVNAYSILHNQNIVFFKESLPVLFDHFLHHADK